MVLRKQPTRKGTVIGIPLLRPLQRERLDNQWGFGIPPRQDRFRAGESANVSKTPPKIPLNPRKRIRLFLTSLCPCRIPSLAGLGACRAHTLKGCSNSFYTLSPKPETLNYGSSSRGPLGFYNGVGGLSNENGVPLNQFSGTVYAGPLRGS